MRQTNRACALALGTVLLAASCGGDDTAAASLDSFVGAWSITGTQTLICNNVAGNPEMKTQTIVIARSMDPAGGALELLSQDANGCAVKLDISGNSATVRPGQSCMPMPNTTVTYDSGRFDLQGTKATYDLKFSSMAGALRCTVSASGTGMKLTN